MRYNQDPYSIYTRPHGFGRLDVRVAAILFGGRLGQWVKVPALAAHMVEPRSTVDSTLKALCRAGWVSQVDREFSITQKGGVLTAALLVFIQSLGGVARLKSKGARRIRLSAMAQHLPGGRFESDLWPLDDPRRKRNQK